MKKLAFIFSTGLFLSILTAIQSCNTRCVDEVLLQTIKMDLQVNSDNLGIITTAPKNTTDTIRSETNQFYNYPEFRRFGSRICPRPELSFIASAYAQDDCPEQTDYISRMDPEKTEISLNVDYNGSAIGLGVIEARTNLMDIPEIKTTYLQDVTNNIFLNGGAPSPLTFNKNFFQPINGDWVTFYFLFVEIDGTEFVDSTFAFIDIAF